MRYLKFSLLGTVLCAMMFSTGYSIEFNPADDGSSYSSNDEKSTDIDDNDNEEADDEEESDEEFLNRMDEIKKKISIKTSTRHDNENQYYYVKNKNGTKSVITIPYSDKDRYYRLTGKKFPV